MLRLIAVIILAGAFWAGLSGQAERWILFPFDPTRVSPAEAGARGLTEVEFSSDGETLIVWIKPAKPGKPVIVYLHGNAGNLAVRAGRFRKFTDRGYGVVALGYRGSSGSTGTPTAENVDGDVARLFAALPKLVGRARVVVYGESLGTGVAVAMNTGLSGQDRIAAMVLEAPYTAILDIGRQQYPSYASLWDQLPERWPTKLRIARQTTPLLVLHGTEDDVIPPQMGRAVFEASAAKDKRFYAVKGAGHTDVWQADAQRVLWQFLTRF